MAKKFFAGIAAAAFCLTVYALAPVLGNHVRSDSTRDDGSTITLAATQSNVLPADFALTALASLPVKGRAPQTGYERTRMFGQAWKDMDRNGCDTRNDILGRDLTNISYKEGTHGCVVISGVLDDPYSGKQLHFTRGQGTSELVQIDHVVALSDAWQKGAQQLDQSQREQLANDPLNLLAVDGALNQQKSDADAATWLPPNQKYRCTYVSRQIAVKKKYHLWVTTPERDAMTAVLQKCER
ncbi:MAG: HNH endonuclease family protein [Actinomycetaceae bacterium]|nr:HNH endonuclease family protein [Actinomycetaceae bacterium]MDY5855297.1 HNH endonuclease family protein [Arcanobacterium sp.]